MRDSKITVSFYGEIYKPEVNDTTTVLQLKDRLELMTGIPIELQKISFLDRLEIGTVHPDRPLKSFGILPRSKLQLSLVSEIDYKEIIFGARKNDLATLKLHGIIDSYLIEPGHGKQFDPAIERYKIIENSFTADKKQTFGLYTNHRVLKKLKTTKSDTCYIQTFNKQMAKIKQEDLTSWRDYRLCGDFTKF